MKDVVVDVPGLSIPHFRIPGKPTVVWHRGEFISFQFLILGYKLGTAVESPNVTLSIPHFRILSYFSFSRPYGTDSFNSSF